VDYRHDRLRASPFFYNTPEDHVALVETIASMTP